MWRPADEDRVLLMAGQTIDYAVEPRGEYVFGVVANQPMRARRGLQRRLVRPGHVVAWDPSGPHGGTAISGRPWTSRLMVIDAVDLAALASDDDTGDQAAIEFAEPVVSDPQLVREFLRLHFALEEPTTRLERDERLTQWLRMLIDRCSTRRQFPPTRRPGDDRAVRLACDYLAEHLERNVGLDELSAAAGIGKFRLIRLVRERTGLPPHSFHLAYRIRAARRLLEAGHTIGDAATATGFADQSHLHRHFYRGLGMTPGRYQRRFVPNDPKPAPFPEPHWSPLPGPLPL